MARIKTVEQNPEAGAGKPGNDDGATSKPGFREPSNKGSKAMKKKKKGSKKK